MGLCVSLPSPYTTHATYTGAGILFSNPSVALAGVQKYWKVRKGSEAVLSGFGGRKEATDLDWFHTAWREVIEELFHVKTVPLIVLYDLRNRLPPADPAVTGGYVMLRYGFRDLVTALKIIRHYIPTSPLYKVFPITVADLVTRRHPSKEGEIGALALLPTHRFKIAPEFQEDLRPSSGAQPVP